MKGELIVGLAFIIIGLIIKIISYDTKSAQTTRKINYALFAKNIFFYVFLIVGFLSLSQYFLDIGTEDIIHWKNGIFLFFVILSLTESTDKIIDWILQKMENKKKTKCDLA